MNKLIKLTSLPIKYSLSKRPILQKIVANTSWLLIDKIIRMSVSLVVGVWVARYLGPTLYGTLNYVQAIVALFVTFSMLGLDSLVVRELVNRADSANTVIGTAFVLKFSGSIVSLFLSVMTVALMNHHDTSYLILSIVIASCTIFQSFDVIDFWFQSLVKSKYTVISKNSAFLISAMMKVYLIEVEANIIAFASASLVEIIISSIVLNYLYFNQGNRASNWKFDRFIAICLLKESAPLVLSTFAVIIYMKIDIIMIGQMKGINEVGIYSAAARLSEVWYFLPSIIVSSISPAIFRVKANDETLYYQMIGRLFYIVTIMAYVIVLPVTLFSEEIIHLLYGINYKESSLILSIHVWSGIFVFLGVAKSVWIIAEGLSIYALYISISGALINVILNLMLIPKYGAVGSAVATLVSYAISDYIMFLIIPKLRRIGKMMTASLLLRRKVYR
jgi:polysaccharide transporter, PST family